MLLNNLIFWFSNTFWLSTVWMEFITFNFQILKVCIGMSTITLSMSHTHEETNTGIQPHLFFSVINKDILYRNVLFFIPQVAQPSNLVKDIYGQKQNNYWQTKKAEALDNETDLLRSVFFPHTYLFCHLNMINNYRRSCTSQNWSFQQSNGNSKSKHTRWDVRTLEYNNRQLRLHF